MHLAVAGEGEQLKGSLPAREQPRCLFCPFIYCSDCRGSLPHPTPPCRGGGTITHQQPPPLRFLTRPMLSISSYLPAWALFALLHPSLPLVGSSGSIACPVAFSKQLRVPFVQFSIIKLLTSAPLLHFRPRGSRLPGGPFCFRAPAEGRRALLGRHGAILARLFPRHVIPARLLGTPSSTVLVL